MTNDASSTCGDLHGVSLCVKQHDILKRANGRKVAAFILLDIKLT